MLLTSIRKEMLSNILSMRYALVFFLFLSAAMASVVVRTEVYKKNLRDYHQTKAMWFQTASSVDRFYQSGMLGLYVEKQPNPLSIFAEGLENAMTRAQSIESFGVSQLRPRKLGFPVYAYSLKLDMVTIVNLVCSLLALILLFDAVCGEREQGTLKVLLSGPLPRDTIILSKLVAGIVTLLIPLLLVWGAGLAYVLLVAKISLPPEFMIRLALLVALTMVFVCAFSTFGIAVSCWVHRAATGLVVCLFFWGNRSQVEDPRACVQA